MRRARGRTLKFAFDHHAYLGAKGVQGERFRQHVHAWTEKVASEGGVLSIAGDEKHLQVGPRGPRNFRELPAVDVRQHDVGDHEVDPSIGLQKGDRWRASEAKRTL